MLLNIQQQNHNSLILGIPPLRVIHCEGWYYTLIETARMNKVDPEAWLRWVFERVADQKMTRLDDLMPWKWAAE